MLIIIASTVLLVVDSPLVDPDGTTYKITKTADIFFTVVFVVEAILKVMTYGFLFNGKHSYLRSLWNIFDFAIVLGSILDLSLTSNSTGVRAIRSIRILRPIRIVARN